MDHLGLCRNNVLVLGLLAVGFVVVLTTPTLATLGIAAKLADHYKLDEKTACALCHSGKGEPDENNLNVFGKSFGRAYAKESKGKDRAVRTMEAVAAQDADGDGATNMEEIALGTQPGDPKSAPAADKLAEYRKAHPRK